MASNMSSGQFKSFASAAPDQPPISRLPPGQCIQGELLAVELDGIGGQTIVLQFWTGPARYSLPEEVVLPPIGSIVDIFCVEAGVYSVRELA